MRRFGGVHAMVLAVALGAANGGCILIPEIEDRIVELAVGGTTTVQFVSSGTINTYNETSTVNILDGLNLGQILADAGVDPSNVSHIALAGIEYRVTVADPEPNREIVNGTITIARNGSGDLPLISAFNAGAGAVTGWQAAPLDPGGAAVTEINAMLNDILNALPGSPASNLTTVTYHIGGDSSPPLVPTDFTWELKIKITITGTVAVSVLT